jgi:putative tryptophan/tyrosine transport system substrate-binding protein
MPRHSSRGAMRRREFITVIAGAAAWPITTYAQQRDGQRRIAVLMTIEDSRGQARMVAFREGLQQLGWTEGRNIRIDARWSGGDDAKMRKAAAEVVALAPEVILATGSSSMGPLMQVPSAVPTVFVIVPDPVGAGYVNSLARPGGNATGFSNFEFSFGGKWLDVLKQIAPGITRVAVLRDPAISAGLGQYGAVQAAASSFGVEPSPINLRDASEIERAIVAFAGSSNGGLIVTGSPLAFVHRGLIITLAVRHKLPSIFLERSFVAEGGLISYGPDLVDQYRRAASYVDRILKGEKPADLPVQAPTKYELAINLKTAKALGLTVPSALLSRADEIIE